MPQRFLKPGLPSSKRFNRVSWPAQGLFVRLLSFVDDMARFDADPEMLASSVFPYGDPRGRRVRAGEVQGWLEELRAGDLLCLYIHGEKQFLHLHRWTERCRAERSRFPAPPAGVCQHLLSNVVRCQQSAANAASPSSASANVLGLVPGKERREGTLRSQEVGLEASKVQFGALMTRKRELEAKPRGSWSEAEREEWKKIRADLQCLNKKQRAGDFS